MAHINRLWLCEKREMALALADGLGAAFQCTKSAQDRFSVSLSNGDVVAWLRGHLLMTAPPEAYLTPEQSRGSAFDYLPLAPRRLIKWPAAEERGKGMPKSAPAPSEHLRAITTLIGRAKEIVNAGDTDREGQLIVDELLEYAKVDPDGSTKPVRRFKHDDPDTQAIVQMLRQGLDENSSPRWRLKRKAAEVRERGDFCMGMSASRAWKEVTGISRMSAGRVQSPVLNLVVQRDQVVENFKAVDYFVPVLVLKDGTLMRWHKRADAAGRTGFDDAGRIVNRAIAEEIVQRILSGYPGTFDLAECIARRERPPLPFDLSSLQVAAARRLGLSLKEVSDAAQALYSKHKVISYIGTDCRYLPDSVLAEARSTMQSLRELFPKQTAGTNMDLRSPAFNQDKVDEHFAIIPTGKKVPEVLSAAERGVFNLVARRFMAQFYPDHEYAQMRLGAKFGADQFRASQREEKVMGWLNVEGDSQSQGEDVAAGDQQDLDDDDQAQGNQEGRR